MAFIKIKSRATGVYHYVVFARNRKKVWISCGKSIENARMVKAQIEFEVAKEKAAQRWKDHGPVPQGRVYFVQGTTGGLVKIGFTVDGVKRRLLSLQMQSPVHLRVLLSFPGTRLDEAALHGRFAIAREHGEWFRPVPEILSFLAERRSLRAHGRQAESVSTNTGPSESSSGRA